MADNHTGSHALKLFVSYAHEDEEIRRELTRLLEAHEDKVRFKISSDHALHSGTDYEPKLLAEIREADLLLTLVSPSFLNSKFIRETELPAILERVNAAQTMVVPVILEDCPWDKTGLKPFQATPRQAGEILPIREWKPWTHGARIAANDIYTAALRLSSASWEYPPTPGPTNSAILGRCLVGLVVIALLSSLTWRILFSEPHLRVCNDPQNERYYVTVRNWSFHEFTVLGATFGPMPPAKDEEDLTVFALNLRSSNDAPVSPQTIGRFSTVPFYAYWRLIPNNTPGVQFVEFNLGGRPKRIPLTDIVSP